MTPPVAPSAPESTDPAAATRTPVRAATMEDVARLAGVTKMTVSYALSGKRPISERTREAVLLAARELNFSVNAHAQRLSGGRNQRDVCIYTVNMSVGVDMLKVKAIRQKLRALGYNVSFHSDSGAGLEAVANSQSCTLSQLRSQRPAAIVCETTDLQKQALQELHQYQEEGGLVLCFDSSHGLSCDEVVYDHEASLYTAAAHLLRLGHRRLGLYILGPARPQEPHFVTSSEAGFLRAVQEFGGSSPADWSLRGQSYENHESDGAALARVWLSRPRSTWPTAICMVNDTAAAAFIATMLRAGVKVPQDISIVGTDNLPISQFSVVPITTVTHPVASLAEQIVELLIGRLEGRLQGPAQQLVVHGQLVERESTRALCPC